MKVFIIGSGNVAFSLGQAIFRAGHEICGVYGRSIEKALLLSKKLHCKYFEELNTIPKNCDVYLLAVSDDAIAHLSAKIPQTKGVIAHTSGTTPLSSLGKITDTGVFYPVQTIKNNFPRSFKKIPFCLEGSNERSLKKLMELAGSISNELYQLNSKQRMILHLSAVFTNNFNNHLLSIARDLLRHYHLPDQLLIELARATVINAFEGEPYSSQTGPAVRNDVKTIDKHLEMLKKHPGRQQIYRQLTDDIINVHNNKKK